MFAVSKSHPSKRIGKSSRGLDGYKYGFALLSFVCACVALIGYVCYRDEISERVMGRPSSKTSGALRRSVARLKATASRHVFGAQGDGGDDDGDDTDDADDCKDVNDVEDKCAYVTSNCQFSSWANYMKLRYCTMSDMASGLSLFLCVTLFLSFCAILLSVLGNVGGVFFVSSLVTISNKLGVSSSVSGITFLAFGNGSPDIFSALAASRANNFNLLQGSLMGASVCLSTFVLGLIIFNSNGLAHTSRSFFWRSFTGYAMCMALVIGFCANGHVSFTEGILFVVLYVVYVVLTVIYLQVKKYQQTKREKEDQLAQTRAKRGVATQEDRVPLLVTEHNAESGLSDGCTLNTMTESETDGSVKVANVQEDDELEEREEEEEDDVDHTTFMEGISWPHPDWEEQGALQRNFGKMFHVLAFPFSVAQWLSIPSTHVMPHHFGPVKRFFTFVSPFGASVMVCLDIYNPGDFDDEERVHIFIALVVSGFVLSCLVAAFFYFVALPRNARHLVQREEVRAQVAALTESNPADEAIDKLTAKWDLAHAESADISLHALHIVLSLIALGGSILWLSLIADEIVALLQSVGLMSGISSILIGLTVVALANSLPDAISNSALAKAGHYDTSFSAVIFAPLLTTLMGLGLSITTNVKKQPGEQYVFPVDTQLIYTWCAVCGALLSHMIVFPLFKYNPPKWYGLALIGGYLLFLTGSVIIEVVK